MSDIKESFLNKVDELREEKIDEVTKERAQKYIDTARERVWSTPHKKLKNRQKGIETALDKLGKRETPKVPTKD